MAGLDFGQYYPQKLDEAFAGWIIIMILYGIKQ